MATTNRNALVINGVVMPTPTSLTPSRNKIWSQNSGRQQNGVWAGDIIGKAWRLDVTWEPCSATDMQTILNALDPTYIQVQFINPKTNAYTTREFYSGDESLEVYSYAMNDMMYSGITVSLVQTGVS